MLNFKGKKVAVLGFGIEGESAVEFLLKNDAQVSVFDEKKEEEFDAEKIKKYKSRGVNFEFQRFYSPDSFDVVIRSPGVSLIHDQVEKVRSKGIPITSATKIFFDLCPGTIIGVTGTKGKGTTSSLIYEMLKKGKIEAFLGGNIGLPPLSFLDKLTKDSWVVLELSSFQLQDLTRSPHIAVMLMVTSEHLDVHKDVSEYVEAKRNILKFQTEKDFAVLNRDYPATNESDIVTDGHVYQVSRERGVREEGCFVEDGKVMVKIKENVYPIIEVKNILLPGKHNWENVCAAVMAATLAGVSKKTIAEVLKTFKGLEHRLELVATINGVRYYDDSFSTTPETAQAAIEAFDAPEILILGGSSKNSDFTALGRLISAKENIKAIIGIGKEWKRIKETIRNKQSLGSKDPKHLVILEGAKDMHAIVQAASKIASLGDVVLLSPACASFDMFRNYKDRGEQFKKEVLKLKQNTSQ